jgi:hypothetical protein
MLYQGGLAHIGTVRDERSYPKVANIRHHLTVRDERISIIQPTSARK